MNPKRIAIFITDCLLICFALLFRLTDGLMDASGGFYVSELLSGGSDDNICIEFSCILFIPLLLFLVKPRRKIALWELLLGNVILLVQLVLLFAIESASIAKTVLAGNWPLLLWSISYFALFAEVNVGFVWERFFNGRKKTEETCAVVGGQKV